MKKIITLSSLILASIYLVVIYANNIAEVKPKTNNIKLENLSINENLYGENGSATYLFSTSEEQPYYKISIENTSNSNIVIIADKKVYSIPKGTISFVGKSLNKVNIDITSSDGSPLSGHISVIVTNEVLK